MPRLLVAPVLLVALLSAPALAVEERNVCAACHERHQPGLVAGWRLSAHARALVGCEACHGVLHTSGDDVAFAQLPTLETCERCHPRQAAQFRSGKHARAWTAVKAFPTFHHLSLGRPEEPGSCATCHLIGLKTPDETAALRKAGVRHGQASCDACHARHLFSAQEARQPEACRGCHGALQYDAWASSKHGTSHALGQAGRIPAAAAGPSCQACHLPGGDHANRTPWGSLALRLPLPEDEAWAEDKRVLLVALGLLDAGGGDGPRTSAVIGSGLLHLDRIDFQSERHKVSRACGQCHGAAFVREELDRREALVRQADALSASAVREVAALYREGLLERRGSGPFPDLVTAQHGAPVEQRLAAMFFDHRARLVASAFHLSPAQATWAGAMARDLAAIREAAQALRRGAAAARAPAAR